MIYFDSLIKFIFRSIKIYLIKFFNVSAKLFFPCRCFHCFIVSVDQTLWRTVRRRKSTRISRHSTWNAMMSDLSLLLQIVRIVSQARRILEYNPSSVHPFWSQKGTRNLSPACSRFPFVANKEEDPTRNTDALLRQLVLRIREFIASIARCTSEPDFAATKRPLRDSVCPSVLRPADRRDIRLSCTSITHRPQRLQLTRSCRPYFSTVSRIFLNLSLGVLNCKRLQRKCLLYSSTAWVLKEQLLFFFVHIVTSSSLCFQDGKLALRGVYRFLESDVN